MFAALDADSTDEEEEEEKTVGDGNQSESGKSRTITSSEKARQERKERRLEEFEALVHIYADECWKESATDASETEPIYMRIGPRQWAASCTAPTLVVKAERSEGYPDVAALGPIDLHSDAGEGRVPGKLLAELRKILNKRAAELMGEVAMHEMVRLCSLLAPPSQSGGLSQRSARRA